MRIKPGCGCLLLLLAVANLAFLLSAIISMFRDPAETAVAPSKLMLAVTALVFAANIAVAVMLALASFRGTSLIRKPETQEEEEAITEETGFVEAEGSDDAEDQG